jgi:hypothetical protein
MSWQRTFGIVCFALLFVSPAPDLAARTDDVQGGSAAAAAAKASPELVSALGKELGVTPEQAAGAAGSLFSVAKSQLKPEQFSQVSKAVPGMDLLLGAAPAMGGSSAITKAAGAAGGLVAAGQMFSKLGLKPELVSKAVPIVTSFVTKSGGANVGSLLAGVLK